MQVCLTVASYYDESSKSSIRITAADKQNTGISSSALQPPNSKIIAGSENRESVSYIPAPATGPKQNALDYALTKGSHF